MITNNTTQTICGNCKFFTAFDKPSPSGNISGLCRGLPPSILQEANGKFDYRIPITRENSICSLHKLSEGQKWT